MIILLLLLLVLVSSAVRLVVADLDFTLWRRPRFRTGPPFVAIDGGGVRSACGKTLALYDGARQSLARLSDAGIPVAIVSRTHRELWARQWLSLLQVDSSGRTVMDVVGAYPIVIRDGSKDLHLREVSRRSGISVCDMLFFDDSERDVLAVERLGCPAVHCSNGQGLTLELLEEGLRRAEAAASSAPGCSAEDARQVQAPGLAMRDRTRRRRRGHSGGHSAVSLSS